MRQQRRDERTADAATAEGRRRRQSPAAVRQRPAPAQRARARPRTAGGADDRGPGRPRADRRPRRGRGARLPGRRLGGAGGVSACDSCLRRAHLIGLLAPRVAGLLDRPGARASGILALTNAELIAAVAGDAARDVERELAGFDPSRERAGLWQERLAALCRHDERFPAQLGDLHDPPTILFVRGELPELEPAVAIVGTRSASPYGLEVAYELGRGRS